MNKREIANQILTTNGINSRVRIESEGLQQYKTAGHIGLYDFDGNVSKKAILERTLDLPGVNVLWRSSKTGYHLWNLSVMETDDVALMGLQLRADCKHVQQGYVQGRWVLRISSKMHKGKAYKPAPKLLHTWCNESYRAQSKPHLRIFEAITCKKLLSNYTKEYEWIGCALERETYQTFTDKMRAD